MAEEVTEPVQDKAEGFGAALSKEPAAEPVVETKTAVVEPAKVEPAKVVEPVKDPETGILKGLKAERGKRQQAEADLKAARAELAQFRGEAPPADEPTKEPIETRVGNQLISISEQTARLAHKDYDEKFAAFKKAAVTAEGHVTELYDIVMNRSENPGEAAYQAGRTLLFQEKYGTDPDKVREAIRAEAEKELEESLRTKITAEVRGRVARKDSQPTDITAGGAAGGADEPVLIQGFAHVLAKQRRR